MIHIWLSGCAGASFLVLLLWLVKGKEKRRIRSGLGVGGIFLTLGCIIAAIVFRTHQLEIGDWWHAESFRRGEMIASTIRVDQIGTNKRYHDARFRVLVFGRVDGVRGILEAGYSDSKSKEEGYLPVEWASRPPDKEVAFAEGSRIQVQYRPGMGVIDGRDVLRCLPSGADPAAGPGRSWWIAGVIADAVFALLLIVYAICTGRRVLRGHHHAER